ncbi:TPA: hypothetical protein SLU92_000601 [Pseudomonas aeruginosa]|nr:hypothetical protein [Pseudomonas aeruginosa]HEK2194986.1 hypothetical protein [Pseudomonas aeruginosa]
MDSLERFKKLQGMKASVKDRPLMHAAADSGDVAKLLSAKSDQERIEALDYFSSFHAPEVNTQEARELVRQLEVSLERSNLDRLLKSAQRDLVGAIAGPLGLGKFLSVYDKAGGNVDTIHNVRNQVYATSEAQQKYAENPEYNSSLYHGDDRYKRKNAKDTIAQEQGVLEDSYTGQVFGNKHVDPRNLDHTISAKEIHVDPGRVLAGLDGVELANTSSNLNPTKELFNIAKGQKKAEDLVRTLQSESPKREARISELKAKPELTVKEKNELKLHIQKQAVADNPERLLALDKAARDEYESRIRSEYYGSEKFRSEVVHTGVKEAGKMGVQQAFGLLMVEFYSSAFEEVRQLYKHGRQSDSLLEELGVRLRRVAASIVSKWEDIFKGFGGGFISGFISNAVTVLINSFVTTGKRVVRLIREGILSLLKALKMLVLPPEGLTFSQAAHESMKLLAVGGIVVGGVALEESVELLIKAVPFLIPYASVLTAVFVGALTALCMTFVCYLIDKLDLLGVVKAGRDMEVSGRLDAEIEERVSRSQYVANEIERFLLQDNISPKAL